jgi:hypothetical protein
MESDVAPSALRPIIYLVHALTERGYRLAVFDLKRNGASFKLSVPEAMG